MKCQKCQIENEAGTNFCYNCRGKLFKVTTAKKDNAENMIECSNCHTKNGIANYVYI
jgi:hypothetical protein